MHFFWPYPTKILEISAQNAHIFFKTNTNGILRIAKYKMLIIEKNPYYTEKYCVNKLLISSVLIVGSKSEINLVVIVGASIFGLPSER